MSLIHVLPCFDAIGVEEAIKRREEGEAERQRDRRREAETGREDREEEAGGEAGAEAGERQRRQAEKT